MSEEEKTLLADLCAKFKDQIENGKREAKHSAWKELTAEFNATSTADVCRDITQLRRVRIMAVCSTVLVSHFHKRYTDKLLEYWYSSSGGKLLQESLIYLRDNQNGTTGV